MELTKAQDKFIRHKTSGYQVLKGKEGTGKSTASIKFGKQLLSLRRW